MNASNSDLEHYSVLLTVDGDKLDYELQQIWSLIIKVSDGLNPSDSYSFLIQVEDEPDNRPEWQSVPSVKDITEGISEVRVIKYQKYEFDIPFHSLAFEQSKHRKAGLCYFRGLRRFLEGSFTEKNCGERKKFPLTMSQEQTWIKDALFW